MSFKNSWKRIANCARVREWEFYLFDKLSRFRNYPEFWVLPLLVLALLPFRNMLAAVSPQLAVLWALGIFMLPGVALVALLRADANIWERLALALTASFALPGLIAQINMLVHTSIVLYTAQFLLLTVLLYMWAILRAGKMAAAPREEDRAPVRWWLQIGLLAVLAALVFFSLHSGTDKDQFNLSSWIQDTRFLPRMFVQEPIYGAGFPIPGRYLFSTWIVQQAMISVLSGVDPSLQFLWLKLPLMLISLAAMFYFARTLSGRKDAAAVMTIVWGMYLLLAVQYTVPGYELIVRPDMDKVITAFTLVPVGLAIALNLMNRRVVQDWAWFCIFTAGAALMHPLAMVFMGPAMGAFGIQEVAMTLSRPKKDEWWMHLSAARFRVRRLLMWINWDIVSRLARMAVILIIGLIPALISAYVQREQGWISSGLNDTQNDPSIAKLIKFTLNMERIQIFSNGSFALHPRLIFQGVTILALIGLPIMLWKIRTSRSVRLLLGTIVVFSGIMMFGPTAALISEAMSPVLIYRLSWPISLTSAMAAGWGIFEILRRIAARLSWPVIRVGLGAGATAALLVLTVPQIVYSYRWIDEMRVNPHDNFCTYAAPLLAPFKDLAPTSTFVLAEHDINLCLTGFAPNVNVLEFRDVNAVRYYILGPRDEGWRRVTDSVYYSRAEFVNDRLIDILDHWNAKYLIVRLDSPLEQELRHMPDSFTPFSTAFNRRVYAVIGPRPDNPLVAANSLLVDQRPADAVAAYQKLLDGNADTRYLALIGLGRAYLDLGRLDDAITTWNQAAQTANEGQAYALIGDGYILKGDLDAATRAYEQAVALQPDNVVLHIRLGLAYGKQGLPTKAQPQFETAISQDAVPGTKEFNEQLGLDLQDISAFDLAAQAFDRARVDQNNETSYLLLGQLYMDQRQFNPAEKYIRQYIAMDPWNADGYNELGDLYQAKGDAKQAIAQYQKAYTLDPRQDGSAHALAPLWSDQYGTQTATTDLTSLVGYKLGFGTMFAELASLDAQSGQFDQAIAQDQKAIAWQQQTPEFWRMLGEHQLAAGMRDEAAVSLQKARDLSIRRPLRDLSVRERSTASSDSYLLRLYRQEGKNDQALGVALELIREDPTRPDSYVLMGQLLEELGQKDQALAQYQAAIQIAPFDSASVIALGDYYSHQGQYDQAIGLYNQAIALGANADAHQALGDVYLALGKTDQAVAEYKQVILWAPGQGHGYVSLGKLYWQQGEQDQAIAQYKQSIKLDPGFTDGYIELGSAYSALGRTADAQAVYQQAIQNLSAEDTGYEQLAHLFLQTGDTASAKSTYEASIAKFSGPNAVQSQLGLAKLTMRQGSGAPGRIALESPLDPAAPTPSVSAAKTAAQAAMAAQPTNPQTYIELATLDQLTGDWAQAEKDLQSGIAINPGSPDLFTAAGDLYTQEGQSQKAMASYQQALNFLPTFGAAHHGLSNLYRELGQMDKAQTQLETALKLEPGNTSVLDNLIDVYLGAGEVGKAQGAALIRKDLAPGQAQTFIELGKVHQAQGQFDTALTDLRRATALEPGNAQASLALGELLAAQAKNDQAQAALRQSIQSDQTLVAPHLALADILQRQGHTNDAIVEYKTAAMLDLTQDSALLALGKIAEQQGNLAQAQTYFDRAIAAVPTDPAAFQARAGIYLKQGQFDQAYQELVQATKVDPGVCQAYQNLGDYWAGRGDFQQSQANYLKALDLTSCAVTARVALGDLYAERAQPNQAVAEYQQAIGAHPGDPFPYVALGDILTNQARWDIANTTFSQAIQHDPSADSVYAAGARSLLAQGKLDRALSAAQDAVRLAPSNPFDWLALGQVYQARGQTQDAENAYQQAAQANQQLPDAYIALGNLQARFNRSSDALANFQQAIKVAPGDARPYIALGSFYQSRAMQADALHAFQQAVAADKSQVEALVALGQYDQALGHLDDAEQTLQQAVSANMLALRQSTVQSSSVQALVALGNLHSLRNDRTGAEQSLKQAIALAPSDAGAHIALGQLYQSQARVADALTEYQTAAQVEPSSAQANISLGDLFLQKADPTSAEQAYRNAIAAAPADDSGYLALALFYEQRGQYAQAYAELDLASNNAPSSAKISAAKGDLQRTLANPTDAEQHYKNAIALAPTDPTAYTQLGLLYQDQARPQDALAQYQRAVSAAPAFVSSWLALGGWYEWQADYANAEKTYLHAVSAQPTDPGAYVTLSQLYRIQGRQMDALKELQAGLQAAPGSATLSTALGDYYLHRSDWAIATHMYEQAVQQEPGNIPARAGLAQAYEWQEQFPKAEQFVKETVVLAPGVALALQSLGDYYTALGDLTNATAAYRQALAVSPTDTAAHQHLIALALLQNQYPQAVQQAEDWQATAAPGDPAPDLLLGLVRRANGDFPGSLAAYDQLLAHSPGNVDSYVGRAQTLKAQGRFREALTTLAQAEQVAPNSIYARISYGESLEVLGRSDEAIQAYTQAESLDAGLADAFIAHAKLAVALGDVSRGINLYQQSIALEPTKLEPYVLLADLYESQGGDQNAAAARLLAQAAQSVRSDMIATVVSPSQKITDYEWERLPDGLKARLALADAYVAHGDEGPALQTLGDALNLWNNDRGLILATIGVVYAQLDTPQAAHSAFQRAQAADPSQIAGYMGEGDLYLKQNDLKDALALYEQAAQVNAGQVQAYARIMESYSRQTLGAPTVLDGAHCGYTTFKQARSHCDLQIGDYALNTALNSALEQQYEALVTANPNSIAANMRLALFYEGFHLEGKAIQAWRQVLKLDPANAGAMMHLGKLNARMENGRSEATTFLGQSMALGGDSAQVHSLLASLNHNQISSLDPGQIVHGVVQIAGTANGSNVGAPTDFASYKIEIGVGAQPSKWSVLTVSSQMVTNGTLMNWDTTQLSNGDYSLRLIVVDRSGNYGPWQSITVHVQN